MILASVPNSLEGEDLVKSLRIGLIILMAALICFGSGCTAIVKGIIGAANNAGDTDTITLGEWEGNTYTNAYFDLTIDIPEGWTILTQEEMREGLEDSKEWAEEFNEDLAEDIDLAEEQTLFFVHALRYPYGSPVDFNQNFQVLAENIGLLGGLTIKSGEDYLLILKDNLLNSGMGFKVDKDIYAQEIGGVSFYVLDSTLEYMDMAIEQKHYITLRKGYAFGFILSYSGAEQYADLEAILETVQLN